MRRMEYYFPVRGTQQGENNGLKIFTPTWNIIADSLMINETRISLRIVNGQENFNLTVFP